MCFNPLEVGIATFQTNPYGEFLNGRPQNHPSFVICCGEANDFGVPDFVWSIQKQGLLELEVNHAHTRDVTNIADVQRWIVWTKRTAAKSTESHHDGMYEETD